MASFGGPSGSPISSKRRSLRRLQPEGEGESSREASAESNDELATSGQDDEDNDTDSLLSPSAPAIPVDNIRELSLGRESTPGPGQGQGQGQAQRLAEREREGGYQSGESAGHDGDISSATAHSTSSLPSSRPLASHVHTAHRAPVGVLPGQLHHQASYRSSAGEEAEDEAEEGEEEDTEGDADGGASPSPSPPVTETEMETDGEAAATTRKGAKSKAVPSRYEGKAAVGKEEPVMWAPAPKGFLSNLTPEEIQEHIRTAIAGDPRRPYKIKPPPVGRPVRIYADGVYDLLHYGHMLQLRQCKLMFPSVHLLVGVCSSSLVRSHKSNPVMSSSERYETMRHVRWVDEVVEDAPWTITPDFIEKHGIDYVAHDEEPYKSAGAEDVYAYVKSIGAFLPTKRTNGISTSELLQRIVEGYREGDYDSKLIKIGHPELCSRQGSEAGTGYGGGGVQSRRDSQHLEGALGQ
ncbi:hypothetical protein JCM8097_006868 [Rhodosporidiobolus ruineniae]